MPMTVYADVLVAVNYLLNLLLLVVAGRISGVPARRRSLCLAALIGAVGSLVIFLPFYGFAVQTAAKLLLAVAMTAVAFGARPVKKLMRSVFIVFVVSFLFAGMMAALEFFVSPSNLLFYNGIVYFHISAMQLVCWSVAAFAVMSLFERIFSIRPARNSLFELTILTNGQRITVKALADTGNSLREPFSGAPVIICSKPLAEMLLAAQPPERLRMIPCSTVAGEGVLRGFRPDEVVISSGKNTVCTSDVYIAASMRVIDGEYQAVMHPQLVTL